MCVAYHSITQYGMYFVWGLFWREISSYIKHLELFRVAYVQGVAKKEEKVTTKIDCCGAKFYHGKDFGALDPA